MNIDNLWIPPVLRRLRYFMNGELSEIFGTVFMNRASWVFRQQPVASKADNRHECDHMERCPW